jgi:ribosomal protein S18 acetylase RimI-like enzyme
MSDLVIRPMRDADRDALVDLKWEMNRTGPELVGDRHDGIATDFNVTREGAANSIARSFEKQAKGEGNILVAEWQGQSVGYLAFSIDTASTSINELYRPSGHVDGIIVTRRAQNNGIGGRLIDEACRLAKAVHETFCNDTLGWHGFPQTR